MFIASMLIFGTIGIFRRSIPLPSAFLAFARGILGGLFMLLLGRLRRKGASTPLPRRILLRLAVTGAMIGFNWMLLFEAYNHTTVAVATLCYYMQPTLVILLSPLVFRERLTAGKGLCALVSIIGMVLVSGAAESGSAQGRDMTGVLLGLGAAALYACVVMMNKKTRGVDAYQKTTVQLLSAGIVMVPYLLLTRGFNGIGGALTSPSVLLLLLTVGILHTGVAYAMYFGSMDGLNVQSIAVLSYIDPVSALFFSAVLLREPLTPLNLVGAVLIIGAAAASEMGQAPFSSRGSFLRQRR
jgi:RarD protein